MVWAKYSFFKSLDPLAESECCRQQLCAAMQELVKTLGSGGGGGADQTCGP